jgi:hypothetical protein
MHKRIAISVFQIFLGCIILCLESCVSAPGEGWKAREGFKHAAPVIAALEQFHKDHGKYPVELQELVPTYLSHDQLVVPSPLGAGVTRIRPTATYDPHVFSYDQNGEGYTLNFSYEGPGINRCFYDSESRKWYSHGYF